MASRSIKNRKNTTKKSPVTGLIVVLAIVFVCLLASAGGAYALGNAWLKDLPSYDDLESVNSAQKTQVYANDETTLLAEFYVENRDPVETTDISKYVLEGTVAIEDERYYEHGGVDIFGIARALVVNMTGSDREGASTITQQFVRNTILSDEMNDITLKRKVREAYLSIKIEEEYSKDQILLMYLNTINYGSGAYGIEAASQTYFSKPASQLTLVQAATLIGIPQSPTYNNPISYPDAALARRNVVLSRMLSNGYITQDAYNAAVNTPLTLNVKQQTTDGIYAYPYFTSYVRDLLLEKYSMNDVFKGGLKVYTTLDPAIQKAAEEAAANKEASIADDLEVAMTAIDPNTGFIKAIVGGKDFYADQYNLATQAKRSPGSAFKTFTLVTALEQGISPTTTVSASATATINGWTLENYDKTEWGTKTMAGAFAVSSNTAFARLITALTPTKVAEVAHRMGITTELEAVPSLTLGSNGVTTLEMANAYATIANGGTRHEAQAISKILDRNGNVIFQADTKGERALTPEIAYAATKVMEGVITSGTGTEARLSSGQVVAGKTGTSENWRDSYFCGITPQISVAIWVGARQERQMPASVSATSVFRDFVGTILRDKPLVAFPTAAAPTFKTYTNEKLQIGIASIEPPAEQKDATAQTAPTPSTDSAAAGSAGTGTTGTGTTPGGSTGGTGTGGTSGTGSGSSGGASP